MTQLPLIPASAPFWITLAVVVVAIGATSGGGGCGGVVTEPRGVLTTPNFPGPPPVPLHCHWVINASWAKDGNITVYLTQQYVLRGLVFYVNNVAANGDAVEEVLYSAEDSSVLEPTYYVRSDRQAVFVNLSLPRLDGNHLRVLQGLRDVYGFNITYEVTVNGEPGRPSCTPMSCSGVGHCLANHDFTNFSCNCPRDYFGVNCSSGPMCTNNTCRNGGTCKVAGTDTIVCDCRGTNYSGVFCQYPPIPDESGECESSSDEFCDCTSAPHIKPARKRYIVTFSSSETAKNISRRLMESSCNDTSFLFISSSDDELKHSIKRNLTRILEKAVSRSMARRNLPEIYDFIFINVTSNGNITFEFSSAESDVAEVNRALSSLMDAGWYYSEGLHSVQTTICSDTPFNRVSIQSVPQFYLEKVASNDNGVEPLRPGSQVVFSCVTVGSNNVSFSWYKEGHLVTPGKTERIWTEISRDLDDRITSLLCVEQLTALDGGRWTCRARDERPIAQRTQELHRVQQCRSLDFYVQLEPIVRMQPPAVSVTKGNAVFLSCLASNDDGNDEFKYSWSQNGVMLKSEGSHVWEYVEYPRGCLLRLQNVTVSSTYTCHVESKFGNASVSARVEVLTDKTPVCNGVEKWSVMPVGAVAIVDCPEGREGSLAYRECGWHKHGNSVFASWNEPDFSACLFDEAVPLEDDLKEISSGYSPSTPRKILQRLFDIRRQRSIVRPHQGEALLQVAMEAWSRTDDRIENHQQMLEIIDLLLTFPRELASPKVLGDLLKVTTKAGFAQTESNYEISPKIFYRNLAVLGLRPNMNNSVARFEENRPRWLASVRIRNPESILQKSLAIVQFRSLGGIIPYTSRINGSNAAYRVLSTIVKTSEPDAVQPGENSSVLPLEGLEMETTFLDLFLNTSTFSDDLQPEYQYWNLTCAYARNLSLAGSWDLSSCTTRVAKDQEGSSRRWIPWQRAVAFVSSQTKVSVQCLCRAPGTYAVLLARFAQKPDAGVPSVAVILALWCCALEAAAALVLPFVLASRETRTNVTPRAPPAATQTPRAQAETETASVTAVLASPSCETTCTASETTYHLRTRHCHNDSKPATATTFRITSCINTALLAVIMATTMCKWDTVLPAVFVQCLLLLGISLPTAQLYLVAVELGALPLFSVSSIWSRQCSRSQTTAIAIAVVPVVMVITLWLSSRDVRATLSQCWSSWLDWSDPACWAIAVPSSLVAVGGVAIAAVSRRLSSITEYSKRVNNDPRCGSVVRLCAILVCHLAFLFSAVLYTSVPGLATQVAFIFASFLLGYSLLLCYVLRLEKQWPVLSTPWCGGEDDDDEVPPPRSSTSTTDCECESRWLPKILRRGAPNSEPSQRFSAPSSATTAVMPATSPLSLASATPSMTVESPDSLRPLIESSKAIRGCPDGATKSDTTNGVAKETIPVRTVGKPRQLIFPPAQQSPSRKPSEDNAESTLLHLRTLSNTYVKKNNGYLYMRGSGAKEQCSADVEGFLGGRKSKRTERRKSAPQVSTQGAIHCQPRRSSQVTQYEFRRRFLRLDDIEEVGSTS